MISHGVLRHVFHSSLKLVQRERNESVFFREKCMYRFPLFRSLLLFASYKKKKNAKNFEIEKPTVNIFATQ